MSVALCLGLSAGTLHAAPEDPVAMRVEKLAAEAAAAYRAADYQHAVELLERAYQLRQVGALLWNLAKAYEKLGDQEKAIETYRRYSDSTEAEPKLKAKADARIAAYEEAKHPHAVPRPDDLVHTDTVPDAQTHPPEDLAAARRHASERALDAWKARRHRDRLTGFSLGGVGVACALAGTGLWISANQLHTSFATTLGEEDQKRSERDRARLQSIIGDSLWGVAAVTAAVGSYFIWRGYHHERPPTVQAWVAPGLASLSVGGTF